MKKLLSVIKELKNTNVRTIIDERIKQFERIKDLPIEEIFKELCFCLMTANCSAEKCIEIHEQIEDDFLKFSELELSSRFKQLGYRFPNVRSKYILGARDSIQELEQVLNSTIMEKDLRDWLVKNIKGLGYKEGSHFLRNIGFKNLAIIDFHIIDVLEKNGIIKKPKTLTKRKYLEIEEILEDIANKMGLTLSELDLYLWYLETEKILK